MDLASVYWLSLRVADVPPGSAWLSELERRREAGLRVPKRRADWRLGRFTAKSALARLLAGSAADARRPEDLARVEVRPAASGVPEAYRDGERVPWALSISHAEDRSLVAVAGSAGAVGCDIESVAARSPAFLEDSFTQSELAAIARSEAPELQSTLYWSAKESLLKALGEGLRLPLQGLAIESVGASTPASGWRTMEIKQRASARRFLGYWRRDGGSVLTIVGEAPLGVPVAVA